MTGPPAAGRRSERFGARRRGLAVAVLVAAALATVAALAQDTTATATTVTVERAERSIVVVQQARAADGARSILNNRNCEEGVRTTIFYGPPPGYVETLLDDTRLTSSVAVVRVPEDDSDETLELFGGSVTFDRPGCIESVDDAGAERVALEQGRTRVTGTRFFLDQETDVADMAGPIELVRRDSAGRVSLEATADELSFDVASERATLLGQVVVTSDERVTQAERLELDEAAGVAVLTGSPAVSRRGADELRGQMLRYDLETDDVVAIGGVAGTFELGGD